MKLKNWCSVVIFLIASLLIMSVLFIDNVVLNVVALAIVLACNIVLTKYSKICD